MKSKKCGNDKHVFFDDDYAILLANKVNAGSVSGLQISALISYMRKIVTAKNFPCSLQSVQLPSFYGDKSI